MEFIMPSFALDAADITALSAILPDALLMIKGFVVSSAVLIAVVIGFKFAKGYLKWLSKGRA